MDGDFVLVPREPTPQMIDATWDHKIDRDVGIESQNTRNHRIYTAMIAAAPTPPPASQERGGEYGDFRMEVGELAYEMGQFLNTIRPRLVGDEISRSYTLHNRMNKWAYQPPSSAAEEPKVIDLQATHLESLRENLRQQDDGMSVFFDAADEQAKPVAINPSEIDSKLMDGKTGERVTALPLWEELNLEAALQTNPYRANCLREAAAIIRNIGDAVTVDKDGR